jgi:hypothetical protein
MEPTEFRTELEALSWGELRAKAAKDYGIRILPEYKRDDIVRMIVDKEGGATKYVTDRVDLDTKKSRYGWSRITVMPGRHETDTHCRACHNGYQFAIPYEVAVNIPTVTAEYLMTKKVPVPRQNDLGQTEVKYEPRWIVQFEERNYGPNGEKDYLPPEASSKYWNGAREAKLRIKRAFFSKYGYWPTDKVIAESKMTREFSLSESHEMGKALT